MKARNWIIPVGIIILFIIAFIIIRASIPKVERETVSKEEEIVATDEWSETFQNNCLSCHAIDDNGHVERISDVRKTPEGWQDTISRMETAWGLEITDEDKQTIIKELSDKNGLAPEEMDAIMYYLTDSGSDFEPLDQEEFERMQNACLSCHAGGRSLAQYRTEEEWMKLNDFHIGFNPSIIYQMREVDFEKEAEEILAYLATIQPKETDEWQQWQENKVDYDVSGEWRIIGYRPGYGLYSGYATIEKNDDDYYEKRHLLTVEKEEVSFEGNVRSYTGYSLRSSLANGDEKVRGVFNYDDDSGLINGRWNEVKDKGIYADETYYKVDGTALLEAWPKAVQKDASETIRVVGHELKENITVDDFSVSDGLTIEAIEEQIGDDVWVKVSVDGSQDVYTIGLQDGNGEIEISQYEKVDYIKVKPEHGFSRLVYGEHKQSVQLEAIAYSNGADGKKETEDDIEIGMIDVTWELLEFHEGGDDVDYVGDINKFGLFTPAAGGPNEERQFNTNNLGTVIAKATYVDPVTDEKLTGEGILVITLPDYMYVN